MHSITTWNFAKSPNYVDNVDLIYPYSEVPYIGNYRLVKIPLSTKDVIIPNSDLIDHVDYWGEGKINTKDGASGFPNCYNVNHQYQLVSNGPDIDKKIPNRIPVISYTNCDTSSYIKNNSVKLVTLMGAPINKSCARDIGRMIHEDFGKVVVYGFKSNAPEIRNLEEELEKKNIFYCHGYKLSELLKTVTLFPEVDHRSYLNITDLGDELYHNVVEGNFDAAVNISKTLENSDNGSYIVDSVTILLKEGRRNIMGYAYKLWESDLKDIVSNYFPISFKLIFNQDYVKIINKETMLPLKLGSTVDPAKGCLQIIGVGAGMDKDNESVRWKFLANWEENTLCFKIFNSYTEMYMILADGEGDKISQGGNSASKPKSHWFLDPIKVDDDLLFFIINKQFNQGLKLDDNADSDGNKQLLGHEGSVYGDPQKYGWYIAPL